MTLFQLLELHGKTTNTCVVDWLIDRCYTKSVRFADRCFTALAKVYIEVAKFVDFLLFYLTKHRFFLLF